MSLGPHMEIISYWKARLLGLIEWVFSKLYNEIILNKQFEFESLNMRSICL